MVFTPSYSRLSVYKPLAEGHLWLFVRTAYTNLRKFRTKKRMTKAKETTMQLALAHEPFRWSRLWLRKLDYYIIGKFLSTFFFAIMILAVISCVIDYSEKVDNFVSKKVPTGEIVAYYLDFIPHITALLFPLFIFISTIFFTSKLAYKSEIIAILAGGVSFPRFMRPYMVGGGALCLLSLVANHWLIPVANKHRVAFEDKYINDLNNYFH